MVVCLIAYMYLYFRIFEPSLGCFFHYRGGHHERHHRQLNKMYTQCSFVQVQNSVLTCVHCTLYTKPIFLNAVCAFPFLVAVLTVISLANFQQLSNQPPAQQILIIFLIISVGDAALLDAAKKGNLTRVCTQYCSHLASGLL